MSSYACITVFYSLSVFLTLRIIFAKEEITYEWNFSDVFVFFIAKV